MEKKCMVQRIVKKKMLVYGAIAVLLAVTLVASIYTISSPAVFYSVTGISPMKTFASIDELRNFLTANVKADSTGTFTGGPLDAQRFNAGSYYAYGSAMPTPVPAHVSLGISSGLPEDALSRPNDYSTTNIQVAGVDEADTVKTDGNYVYTIVQDWTAQSQNMVYIVKADPSNPQVVGKIALGNNTSLAGMYLSQNGGKLVVVGSNYGGLLYAPRLLSANNGISVYGYYSNSVESYIYVYDVSNKADIVLTRNMTLSGSYFNSRMIGNYLYTVVSEPAYVDNGTVILPAVYNGAQASEIAPTSIYYNDMQDSYFTYTTFTGINVLDDSQAATDMTVMMGGTSNMYVSTSNMYVTFPTSDGATEIYRVGISGANLSFQAKGVVPGSVLNQYSMDEYNGYFRVATTTSGGSWLDRNQQNNLYVLNMNLTTVGKIENMAQGERIYSARFTGDKCYLVTFKQTDPFFVLDLKNPTAPKVAGELKIPGYSSYLHPYDENHIIGLGKENSTVKLALFDVTDMNNPVEIAKYIIGQNADYADSNALYDPKAFLFDLSKQLLVIPVSVTTYGQINYGDKVVPPVEPGAIPSGSTSTPSSTPIDTGSYWQGAYVFNLTPTSGFTLKGGVTQQDNSSLTNPYGNSYDQTITRALYISNTLYTLSNSKVQLNDLDSLGLVGSVNLR
jgi:inhibitor of cysteine peptidase